jgi:hypothetical protein
MRRFLKVGCFGMLLFITFASSVGAQQCVLKVGAWEAYPEEKSGGGVIHRRKETVTGFTSTATNLRTKRLYKGVSLMGHAYYENLPEGNYSIIVRKAGFKTTIHRLNNRKDFILDGNFRDIRKSILKAYGRRYFRRQIQIGHDQVHGNGH